MQGPVLKPAPAFCDVKRKWADLKIGPYTFPYFAIFQLMSKPTRIIFLAVALAALCYVPPAASNSCTYKPAKVKVIQGVVYTFAKQPLENAKLVLHPWEDQRTVIAEITADERGYFRFGKVPYGKYWLVVTGKGFDVFGIEVHVSRFRASENAIIVELAAWTGMDCFSGFIVRALQVWEKPVPGEGTKTGGL